MSAMASPDNHRMTTNPLLDTHHRAVENLIYEWARAIDENRVEDIAAPNLCLFSALFGCLLYHGVRFVDAETAESLVLKNFQCFAGATADVEEHTCLFGSLSIGCVQDKIHFFLAALLGQMDIIINVGVEFVIGIIVLFQYEFLHLCESVNGSCIAHCPKEIIYNAQ